VSCLLAAHEFNIKFTRDVLRNKFLDINEQKERFSSNKSQRTASNSA
jgi:hypothetical protein